jgi:flagellar protein FlgJ
MLGSTSDLSGKFALDTNSLGDLKQSAKAGSPEALKGAATQFESMFINMMMKSMRDATPQDGPMDSQETKTFTTHARPADEPEAGQARHRPGRRAGAPAVAQQSGAALAKEMQSGALAIGSNAGRSRAPAATRLKLDSDSMSTDRAASPPASPAARAAPPAPASRPTCAPSRTSWPTPPRKPKRSPACRPSS